MHHAQPFSLDFPLNSALGRVTTGLVMPLVERALGLTTLGRMYRESVGSAVVDDFPERALRALGISYEAIGAPTGAIPADGPLVVVANHPFGAADGLALLALLRQVRSNVRLLGNFFLTRIPELRPILIETDPFARPGRAAMNARTVRRARDWVRRGGALLVFPAGEVSSVAAPGGALIDAPWRHGVARIALHAGAPVLPIFIEGRNSRSFEWAGRLHPLARTAMLPRELLRQRGRQLKIVVGEPVAQAELAAMGGASAVTTLLRARTYALAPHPGIERRGTAPSFAVADAVPGAELDAEVRRLPRERHLLDHGAFGVFYASAAEAPKMLRELGRLREITFRAAGEGTGAAIDLDRFDDHYWHLFVWHRQRREVVGAYRLGEVDTLTAEGGVRALYTRTLFRFDRRLVDALGPALELGRSFVRQEYQRDYSPLLLLWQGIGQFLVRHPRYRRLIGPVSISATYRPASIDLLVNALEAPPVASPLTHLVAGKRAPRRAALSASARTVADAAKLIPQIEPDGKGIPVLLRHYLKLNAKCLATSVDPAFANVVDALMVVDLDDAPLNLLNRYLTPAGAASFRAVGHCPAA
ncbi:MAG TPA: GNAT family N-acyltransferase [Vicinamibacterales bacterium]|nr:GNAT family N-acyltransferase [Vicinamibacterales bacterium]